MTPHIPEDGNEIFSRIAGETARGTLMFRFSKPETPRAALFVFLRNETRAKSGFVSYVSISLCFDFDPSGALRSGATRAGERSVFALASNGWWYSRVILFLRLNPPV